MYRFLNLIASCLAAVPFIMGVACFGVASGIFGFFTLMARPFRVRDL